MKMLNKKGYSRKMRPPKWEKCVVCGEVFDMNEHNWDKDPRYINDKPYCTACAIGRIQ